MKKKFLLTDDSLKLRHFRDDDHAQSEIRRFKEALEKRTLDVEVRCHTDKKSSSYQLILVSEEIDHLQKAVDLIFNEGRYYVVSIDDQVFLEPYSRSKESRRSRHFLMTFITIMSYSLVFTMLCSLYVLYTSDYVTLVKSFRSIVSTSFVFALSTMTISVAIDFIKKID